MISSTLSPFRQLHARVLARPVHGVALDPERFQPVANGVAQVCAEITTYASHFFFIDFIYYAGFNARCLI